MSTDTRTRPVSPPPVATPRSAPPRSTGPATVGLVLVAVGTFGLLDVLGVDIRLALVVPVLLIGLGLGMIVSAIRGEPAGGLLGLAVTVGILLAIGSLLGAVSAVPLWGGIGERLHEPAGVEQLEDEYRLLMGTLVVDLRDVEFAPGTTELAVSTVLGEVEVRVPEGVAVSVDSIVGGGSATVLGVTQEGLGVDNDGESEDWDTADRRLDLRVGVGLGEVRVTR